MHAKDKQRERHLFNAFDLTPSEWSQIETYQRGVCFLCGQPQPQPRKGTKRLATDHSHVTGEVRGLLCSRCNPILGKLENAFKRYGLDKAGVDFVYFVRRLLEYVVHPPASLALGRTVIGYKGKVGTRVYRKWVKKRSPIQPSNGRT